MVSSNHIYIYILKLYIYIYVYIHITASGSGKVGGFLCLATTFAFRLARNSQAAKEKKLIPEKIKCEFIEPILKYFVLSCYQMIEGMGKSNLVVAWRG